jgi:ABC-type Fe3+/spermidine/putrescine transport system ATPase subunit
MRRRYSSAGAVKAATEMLEVVELADFAPRPATQLSGGQQQRLAIARALVSQPRVLLLDEPLSSLDAKLRQRIAVELKRLQRELGITTIFVTHDQTEALQLSDRVAVMRAGRVEQVGTPREVYEQPASAFVADFVGTSNQLVGTVLDVGAGRARVDLGEGTTLVASIGATGLRPGDRVLATGRPEAVSFGLEPDAGPADNRWPAAVTTDLYQGGAVEYVVELAGGQELRVLAASALSWAAGQQGVVTSGAGAWRVFASA